MHHFAQFGNIIVETMHFSAHTAAWFAVLDVCPPI
jgi:hypothetical protein